MEETGTITTDDLSGFRADTVLHCKMCVEELPANTNPKDWARLSFGSFHKPNQPGIYLQLWCDRHDCNVATIHVQSEEWVYSAEIPLRVKP